MSLRIIAARKQIKIDINQLHALKHVKDEPMVDDGTGKIKVNYYNFIIFYSTFYYSLCRIYYNYLFRFGELKIMKKLKPRNLNTETFSWVMHTLFYTLIFGRMLKDTSFISTKEEMPL